MSLCTVLSSLLLNKKNPATIVATVIATTAAKNIAAPAAMTPVIGTLRPTSLSADGLRLLLGPTDAVTAIGTDEVVVTDISTDET